MTTILGAAASGMAHHAQIVDAIGNNVANLNTAAFKRTRVLGEGAPATSQEPGAPRMGVALTTYDVVQTPGAAYPSDEPLHFAIQDDTFFPVQNTDGTPAYTRYGALSVDAAGNVVAPGGLFLEPPVTVPTGYTGLQLTSAGELTANNPDGARETIGNITVVRFTNPLGLEELGSGLYRESANSGVATPGTPGADGFALLAVGALESSNVNLAEEFTNLIIAQRAYQASAKTFSVGDEMLATATRLTQ